jgi:HSP20 family protein
MVSLRDAMERLLSDSFVRGRGESNGSAGNLLSVDVREQGDNFVISAPTPGIGPDDVEITVRGDLVRVRGERKEENEQGGEDQRWLMREQRYGAFERVVQLPSPVSADGAHADFKDGILTITLPKTEESKERRIPVKSSQQTEKPRSAAIEASGNDQSKQRAA